MSTTIPPDTLPQGTRGPGTGGPARLVAVFEQPGAADAAWDRLARTGVGPAAVRVGDVIDQRSLLGSEQQEESSEAVVGGPVPMTREQSSGAALGAVAGALVGMIITGPLSLIEVGSVTFSTRLLVALIVGTVFGSTVGAVAGGGLGAKGPADLGPTERGIVLSVADVSDAACLALADGHPARLVVVDGHGDVLATLASDETTGPAVLREQLDRLRHKPQEDPHGEWAVRAPTAAPAPADAPSSRD